LYQSEFLYASKSLGNNSGGNLFSVTAFSKFLINLLLINSSGVTLVPTPVISWAFACVLTVFSAPVCNSGIPLVSHSLTAFATSSG